MLYTHWMYPFHVDPQDVNTTVPGEPQQANVTSRNLESLEETFLEESQAANILQARVAEFERTYRAIRDMVALLVNPQLSQHEQEELRESIRFHRDIIRNQKKAVDRAYGNLKMSQGAKGEVDPPPFPFTANMLNPSILH